MSDTGIVVGTLPDVCSVFVRPGANSCCGQSFFFLPTMTFEERRKKLKLGGHNWGDLPQQLPHHVENTNNKARAMPLAQFGLECASMPTSKVKRATKSISPFRLPITTVGWSLSNILESSNAFLPVPRIACNKVDMQTEIDNHEKSGVPVIIEGLHEHTKWPKELFNIDSFKQEVKGEVGSFFDQHLKYHLLSLHSNYCSQRLRSVR